MTRFRISGLAAFAALATAGLLVAGCNPSSSNSSPSAGGKSSAPSTGTSKSSTPSGGGTGGTGSTGGSGGSGGMDLTLFPATVGNTWVYETVLSSKVTGTTTNKVTAVTPDSGGEKVTFASTPDIPGQPNHTTSLTYQLNSDGSIGVPFAQFDNSDVTITGGGIVWPSQAELDSGQPHTSAISVKVTSSGHAITVTGHVTVQGEGTQSITVPAGTYTATIVNEEIKEALEGISFDSDVKTWLVKGVGPVKTVTTSTAAGATTTLVSDVLKSFKQG
jgi:hypothetical protein